MVYTYRNNEIRFFEFGTRGEFEYFVTNQRINYLTLADEFSDSCVLVKITGIGNDTHFCYYSIEGKSEVIILFSLLYSSLCFVLGKRLLCLSSDHSRVLLNMEFSTEIISVLESVEDDAMFIIAESEIICVKTGGEIKWRRQVDLIEDYTISPTDIELRFYDDKPIILDKATGREIIK